MRSNPLKYHVLMHHAIRLLGRAMPTGLPAAIIFSGLFAAHAHAGQDKGSNSTEMTASKPDIVVIMADDMGFSDIASYGGEIDTPNLDRLADGGLRFTQFYNTARCCPTRASLMTGLYPHRAGMGWMAAADMFRPAYRGQLSDDVNTLPEILKTAGYGTYMVGKWHLTRDVENKSPNGSWPAQRGFDRYYGTINGGGSYYTPTTLTRDLTPINEFSDDFYYTDAISENGATFVRDHAAERADQPLFMYVAYTAPHWPLHAPRLVEKYNHRYRAGYDELRAKRFQRQAESGLLPSDLDPQPRDAQVPAWDELEDEREQDRIHRMSLYAAQIEIMDEGIGQIVEALRETGRLDNTLILFLSDNGGCEEGGIWGFDRTDAPIGGDDSFSSYGRSWANLSNTPFKEYKHWVHEGGIATPLVAHWPAGIKDGGAFRTDVGHVIDIAATCVDLAGATPPEKRGEKATPAIEGVSLAPAFVGEPVRRDEPVFWEHEGNRAVRDDQWKLVAKGIEGEWELYDMQSDRSEMLDVADDHPDIVSKMADQWLAWAEDQGVLPMDDRDYGTRIRDFERARGERAGSNKSRFNLAQGDTLNRRQSPNLVNRSARIKVEIEEPAPDGVLIAQGGAQWGWSLYVKDDSLHFAVRDAGQLRALNTRQSLSAGATVAVDYAASGNVTLWLNDEQIATGQLAGSKTVPVDGLAVGSDPAGAVGDYKAPFAFGGKIASAEIVLDEVDHE